MTEELMNQSQSGPWDSHAVFLQLRVFISMQSAIRNTNPVGRRSNTTRIIPAFLPLAFRSRSNPYELRHVVIGGRKGGFSACTQTN